MCSIFGSEFPLAAADIAGDFTFPSLHVPLGAARRVNLLALHLIAYLQPFFVALRPDTLRHSTYASPPPPPRSLCTPLFFTFLQRTAHRPPHTPRSSECALPQCTWTKFTRLIIVRLRGIWQQLLKWAHYWAVLWLKGPFVATYYETVIVFIP